MSEPYTGRLTSMFNLNTYIRAFPALLFPIYLPTTLHKLSQMYDKVSFVSSTILINHLLAC